MWALVLMRFYALNINKSVLSKEDNNTLKQ